jgi:hypothetical protein
MGYDMTRDWKANHNQGRRETGVMSQGMDGNFGMNIQGARNARLLDHVCQGDNCAYCTSTYGSQDDTAFPAAENLNFPEH